MIYGNKKVRNLKNKIAGLSRDFVLDFIIDIFSR